MVASAHESFWVSAPAISPDGRWIAAAYLNESEKAHDFHFAILQLDDGTIVGDYEIHAGFSGEGAQAPVAAWTPDGRDLIYVVNQNANVTVGGIAVTSATNQISNAIPGVTLAVTQPTTSAATLTVSSDPSSLEQQVQAFVTAYNNVVTTGHTDAGYGTTTASNSLLQNDDAVQSTLDQLGQVVAEQVPGSTGAYTSLASVGITLNDDGTLSFDQGAFAAALQADPTSVQRLFVTDPQHPRARSLSAALARIVRARAVNPRFIAGQMRHGYRGAAELAETVDRLVAFAETTEAVAGELFDLLHAAAKGVGHARDLVADLPDRFGGAHLHVLDAAAEGVGHHAEDQSPERPRGQGERAGHDHRRQIGVEVLGDGLEHEDH